MAIYPANTTYRFCIQCLVCLVVNLAVFNLEGFILSTICDFLQSFKYDGNREYIFLFIFSKVPKTALSPHEYSFV